MAITLKDIQISNINTRRDGNIWTFNKAARIKAKYTKGSKTYLLTLNLKKGFRTDGASVPSAFNWFLPRWDNKNPKYDAVAILHDCLYTSKGAKGTFTRSEADDFFRGGMRCAGLSRFKAGIADVCLAIWGNGRSHWGSDDLYNQSLGLFTFTIKELA